MKNRSVIVYLSSIGLLLILTLGWYAYSYASRPEDETIAFDGQPVAARLGDVDAWLDGWLSSEMAFVDRVTSRLPPSPP